jgi:hypothetical protein
MKELKEYLDRVAPNPEKIIAGTEDFNDIDLSPEEEQEALRVAREKKYYNQKKKAYWESVTTDPVITYYNANQLGHHLKAAKTPAGKPFLIDNDNREIVKLICSTSATTRSLRRQRIYLGRPTAYAKVWP